MRIDAHQHFWCLSRGDYGWLSPKMKPLYRDFVPADLRPALDDAAIDGTVLIQAAATEAETDHLLALADHDRWIKGVVGWIDFAVDGAIDRIAERAAHPLLVGLRPMLQDLGDPHWIAGDRQRQALAAMARAGLVLDGLVGSRELSTLLDIVEQHPDLAVVIDHAAKPDIASGAAAAWRAAMRRAAAMPHVAVKLSGLLTEAPAGADATMLQPFADVLFEAFSPERILWGSDWPVLTTASDYAAWVTMSEALTAGLDDNARDAVFGGNAMRIYRLGR